jgi:hypothetical protein
MIVMSGEPRKKAGVMLIELAQRYGIPSSEYTPILEAFSKEKIETVQSMVNTAEGKGKK